MKREFGFKAYAGKQKKKEKDLKQFPMLKFAKYNASQQAKTKT